MIIYLNLERMGDMSRITIKDGQNATASTMFRNLAWLCMERIPESAFTKFWAIHKKFKSKVNLLSKTTGNIFVIETIPQVHDIKRDIELVAYRYSKPTFDKIRNYER